MSHPFSKGFFGNLTYTAVTVGVSLIAPLLIVAGTIALTLVVPGLVIDVTLMTIYFVITCTFYNAFLLIVLARVHTKQGEDVAHYFSILVPARDEEGVIAQTLECILNLDYPLNFSRL
jgi:cellulose synthase/poly-beta-1,6-N-acetylglucosamine synthase-like glycosyltransferase